MSKRAAVYDMDGCFAGEYENIFVPLKESFKRLVHEGQKHEENVNKDFIESANKIENHFDADERYIVTSRPYPLMVDSTKKDIDYINSHREWEIDPNKTIMFPGCSLNGEDIFVEEESNFIAKALEGLKSNWKGFAPLFNFYEDFYKKCVATEYKKEVLEELWQKNGFEEIIFVDDTEENINSINNIEATVTSLKVENGNILEDYRKNYPKIS